MAIRKIRPNAIGWPKLYQPARQSSKPSEAVSLFDLSSFSGVRAALEVSHRSGRNKHSVFVIADDKTGCFAATVAWLRTSLSQSTPAQDWVYLHNFQNPAAPQAFPLPPGMGPVLKGHMAAMVDTISRSLREQVEHSDAMIALRKRAVLLEQEARAQMIVFTEEVQQHGLEIQQDEAGRLLIVGVPAKPDPASVQPGAQSGSKQVDAQARSRAAAEESEAWTTLQSQLNHLQREANSQGAQLVDEMRTMRNALASKVIAPFCLDLKAKFREAPYFADWVDQLQEDLVAHLHVVLSEGHDGTAQALQERYGVNVMVDHSSERHPPLEVVAHPSYENLFGAIQYTQGPHGFRTNHMQLRPGVLHKANGGVLVMRAESLAAQPGVWGYIKSALRDQEIRIEEFHRASGLPVMQAPMPQPIPLGLQIVIVGSSWWYHNVFEADPQLRSHIKLRAEVEFDMPATDENIKIYAALLQSWAEGQGFVCENAALGLVIGYAASVAGNRRWLSSYIDLCYDLLAEACGHIANDPADHKGLLKITGREVKQALHQRRSRRGAALQRHVEEIVSNRIHIHTSGSVIGQINGLTVNVGADLMFGTPVRITARTFASKQGVLNIERDIDMSGPIQKKGVMTLSAFLNAEFGQTDVVSFGCSLTFEQNYVMIDGDSASLAELLAILSALSGIPIRQDVAITGSIDQMGRVQSIGGLHAKIEGFFELCCKRELSGTQGVVFPADNASDLILPAPIQDAMLQQTFHLWSITSVAEAVELMMVMPRGARGAKRSAYAYVSQKIRERLKAYQVVLREEDESA